MALSQATVNVGASQGLTDQQLTLMGATAAQLAAIPPTVRPVAHAVGHAAQSHANVHVAAAPPQPQILMAQQAQQPVAQFMGVGLPVHVGGAAFRVTTMPLWAYVLAGMFFALMVWLAVAGWTRPAGASVTAPPAVSAPVAATQPIVIKIDPIQIKVYVTGVQPGKP